jgi:putative ABC transport system permease protein
VANVLAWPAAFFLMKKWLQHFAYRTEMGICLFVMSGVLSILIALFSVSYQSVRAALVDPVKSLKYE